MAIAIIVQVPSVDFDSESLQCLYLSNAGLRAFCSHTLLRPFIHVR